MTHIGSGSESTAVVVPPRATAERSEQVTRAPRRAGILSSLCIVIAVAIANGWYLLGIRSSDPLLYFSGLGTPQPGTASGRTSIDPNVGWTTQALGHLAALDWLHGRLPLWNPYEGLGQPLAGEMQSAAFFLPFVLLQALPNGVLLFHVALELVAGFGTLLFLRSLRLSWTAATVGACLFALNGTFSVMLNAPFNPIAFLPWALYGIELISASTARRTRPRLGVWVTVFSIGLMLLAGFPETAALEIGFVAVWVVIRLIEPGTHRLAFALWSAAAAIGGLILAAPVLVEFVSFLGYGYTGVHQGDAVTSAYRLANVPTFVFPYLHGGLYPASQVAIGVMPGYLTLGALALAAMGLLRRRRLLRNGVLAAVVLVLLLDQYGFGPVRDVITVLPGLQHIWVAKYGVALIEFTVVIWAAYGIDDVRKGRLRWAPLAAAAALCAAAFGAAWLIGRHDAPVDRSWVLATVGWSALTALGALVALVTAKFRPSKRALLAGIVGGFVVVEAVGIFAAPQLSASPPASVDETPAKFLADNLGTSRFFTLGPVRPNYGSYFGAAELNVTDIPVPSALSDLAQKRLMTPTTRDFFHAGWRFAYTDNSPAVARRLLQAYFDRQSIYRSLSVEYLVMPPGTIQPGMETHGLSLVFRNATAEIWQDEGARPFFRADGGDCRLSEETTTTVVADCNAASTLTRASVPAPGWHVQVNGKDRALSSPDGLVQSVALAPGESVVTFSYRPTGFVVAAVVSLAVLLACVAEVAFALRRRARRRQRLT